MDIWSSENQAPIISQRLSFLAAFIGYIVVQVGASLGYLGASNVEVSAKFPTPLTPEGWAFSIWALIFLLQGLGVVYQVLDDGYEPDGEKQRFHHSIRIPWMTSWFFQAAWQFSFVQQIPEVMWLAFICISCSLFSMAVGLNRLYTQRYTHGPASTLSLYCLYFCSTSITTAWLSVAASVQLLIALLGYKSIQDLSGAAVLLSVVLVAAGAVVTVKRRDTAFGLTLVWALVAVYENSYVMGDILLVHRVVLVGIVVMVVASAVSVLRRREHGGAYGMVGGDDIYIYMKEAGAGGGQWRVLGIMNPSSLLVCIYVRVDKIYRYYIYV